MANKRPVASLNTREYDAMLAAVKEARNTKGISQRALSAKLGQSTTYITRVEQKERRLDVAEFYLLAEALEIDPIELFRDFQLRLKLK